MALSSKSVGSATSSSVAAATVRVGGGGRNVASSTRADVERLDFTPQMGVNGEQMLRFQQDAGNLDPDGRRGDRGGREGFTPLLMRAMSLAGLDQGEDTPTSDGGSLSLSDFLRGIGSYEDNMRTTQPSTVKPGSVMNYLF